MRLTIYQPQYFPRLHYFNRVIDTDTFVILDSTQYVKSLVHINGGRKRHKSFQSDAIIKTALGKYFLTVPVRHSGLSAINETKVDYSHNWPVKHFLTIKSAYGKASEFDENYKEVKQLITKRYSSLASLNIASMLWGINKILGLGLGPNELSLPKVNKLLSKQNKARLTKVITDKETGVKRPGGFQKGTEWTAKICKALGATEYVHGGTAQSGYMKLDYYKKFGVKTIIQDWKCQSYPQQFTEKLGFYANMSIIDLIFNVKQKDAERIVVTSR